jgi:hypothetical protein
MSIISVLYKNCKLALEQSAKILVITVFVQNMIFMFCSKFFQFIGTEKKGGITRILKKKFVENGVEVINSKVAIY